MDSTEVHEPSNVNVPNALTLLRLLLVPVFGWLLLAHPVGIWWRLGATAVFGLAMLTDALDGRIARSYGLVTRFGKLWDPIADKALTGMAFVALSILNELPWWVTTVVLVREWGITLLRFAILKYGVMAANRGGKLKTLVQTIALFLYLPYLPALGVWVEWLGWGVMGLAVILTVLTGLDYLYEAWRLRQRYLDSQTTVLDTRD